jgi:hypothetical protein
MMDVDSIVEYIRHDAALFASAWNEELRRHGMGAIVILPPDPESPGDDVKVEFWTVEELRASLRSLRAEDEFVYRWIRECEEEGGLPVMVLTPSLGTAGGYDLCFHRFIAPPD